MNHIYIHEAHRKLEAAIRCGNWRNTIDAAIQLLHQAIDAEAQNVDGLLDHELEAHEKWSWPVLDEKLAELVAHFRGAVWAPVNAREWERRFGRPLFPQNPTPTPALPSDVSPSPSEPASALEGQGFSTFKSEGEL